MIPYVGLPINPQTAALQAVNHGHAFVSFSDTHPLGLAATVCQSFAIDNGAFPAWKAGKPVQDWTPFYRWASDCMRLPNCDFAVIPDVIDGDEEQNDRLIAEWPLPEHFGAPVWHMHESLARLERLASRWPRLCIGSSGQYEVIGTQAWWFRMGEAMRVLCDQQGRPLVRIHGLRMLDPDVFTRLPFASADSTNIARNIGIDSAWRGTYTPPTKEARAAVMRARLEAHNAPTTWDFKVPTVTPEAQGVLI